MALDYYQILGVGRDTSADEIRSAYRRLMKRFHPDTGHGDVGKTQEINEAYRVLADSERRKEYDTKGIGKEGPIKAEGPPTEKIRKYPNGVLMSDNDVDLMDAIIWGRVGPYNSVKAYGNYRIIKGAGDNPRLEMKLKTWSREGDEVKKRGILGIYVREDPEKFAPLGEVVAGLRKSEFTGLHPPVGFDAYLQSMVGLVVKLTSGKPWEDLDVTPELQKISYFNEYSSNRRYGAVRVEVVNFLFDHARGSVREALSQRRREEAINWEGNMGEQSRRR